MQDYEQYTRISHAPVILPPAGNASVAGKENEAIPESADSSQEKEQAPDLFRSIPRTVQLHGLRRGGNRVLLVQSLLCAILLAVLLLLRMISPNVFESVRNWYSTAIHRVITVRIEAPLDTASIQEEISAVSAEEGTVSESTDPVSASEDTASVFSSGE